MNGIDLTGQRFGRLTVVGVHSRNNGIIWSCRCDCGNMTIGRSGHLRANTKESCGCAVVDAARRNQVAAIAACKTHGMSHTRLDHCYKNIKRRCYDPKNKRWENYGGRGIGVCEEWRAGPQTFFTWALANGYRDDLTIDRIDVNKDYSPDNCRWATMVEQQNNTTRNRVLVWDGKSQTVSQWAREFGVNPKSLEHRVLRGWTAEKIFTQPFRRSRRVP